MRVSVLIPAYNSGATLRFTLDSVLAQNRQADEILVMDDGSTDETASILRDYEPYIRSLWQPNAGLSSARNALIARSTGDLISFLDSDDLWHPRYLETQCRLFEEVPNASAFFVGHTNFAGSTECRWKVPKQSRGEFEEIAPIEFIERFSLSPGPFVMSFCCVPRRVLDGIGSQPFKLRQFAEDVYFTHLLPFWGSIVYSPAELGAYRVREGSLASDRMRCAEYEVMAFELLRNEYVRHGNRKLLNEFRTALAVRRRTHAKILLGAGMQADARKRLLASTTDSYEVKSVFKSLALLAASFLPRSLQPAWPSSKRQWPVEA
jgi:glycosyltransferase involved in cell wall biosynthesis